MKNLDEVRLREVVAQQDTRVLPVIRIVSVYGGLLTVRQVRECCGLKQVQLAKLAGVRPVVVDWFERDVDVRRAEVVQLLTALTSCVQQGRQNGPFDTWKGGRP